MLLAALLNRSALPKLSRPPELPATKLNRTVKPLVIPLTLSDVSIVTPATSRSSGLPETGVTVPVLAGTLEAPLFDALPSSGETEASPLYSKIGRPIVVVLVVGLLLSLAVTRS